MDKPQSKDVFVNIMENRLNPESREAGESLNGDLFFNV